MNAPARRFIVGKPHLIALFDGATIHFIDHDRKSETDLGRVAIPNSPSRRLDTQSEVLIRQIAESRKPIVLRLAEDMGLVCHDRFPETAKSDLKAIVAHRLDTLTPWNAERVMFDAKPIATTGDGQLDALIIAAPNEQVNRGIEALGALGLVASAVDMVVDFPNAPCSLNFLGGTENAQNLGAAPWLTSIAAAITLIVGAYAYTSLTSQQEALASRQVYAEALTKRLADLPDLHQQLDALRNQSEVIAERRRQQPSILLSIEELSQTLPDGVWLKSMDIEGRDLSISGYAPDAEVLLSLIESNASFTAAEFTAPSRREAVLAEGVNGSVDSFALQTRISAPGTRLPTGGRSTDNKP